MGPGVRSVVISGRIPMQKWLAGKKSTYSYLASLMCCTVMTVQMIMPVKLISKNDFLAGCLGMMMQYAQLLLIVLDQLSALCHSGWTTYSA